MNGKIYNIQKGNSTAHIVNVYYAHVCKVCTNRSVSHPQWPPSPPHTTTPWTRPSPHRTYPSKLGNYPLSRGDLLGVYICIHIVEVSIYEIMIHVNIQDIYVYWHTYINNININERDRRICTGIYAVPACLLLIRSNSAGSWSWSFLLSSSAAM